MIQNYSQFSSFSIKITQIDVKSTRLLAPPNSPMSWVVVSEPVPLEFPLVGVVVSARARSFPSLAGSNLLRWPGILVLSFSALVLVCAPNRRHPGRPRCRDCFDNLNERCAPRPNPIQWPRTLPSLPCPSRGSTGWIPYPANCPNCFLHPDIDCVVTGVISPRPTESLSKRPIWSDLLNRLLVSLSLP